MNIINKERFVYKGKKEPLSLLLKRPNINLENLAGKNITKINTTFDLDVIFAVETAIKYEGYEARESQRNKKIKGLENQIIPKNIDYNYIVSLSNESKEKLSLVRPQTLGQASRIDGVRSSDLAVLSIYLNTNVSRETKI